jgi:phosphotriesterase-related protein
MAASSTSEGVVYTVDGPIPACDLGMTLPHEHLAVEGWDHTAVNYANSAFMELVKTRDAGCRTVVDASSIGLPRDPAFDKQLAGHVGIQVVMGTGFFKAGWLPPQVSKLPIEGLEALLLREINEGIGGSGIKAGVIGEIGVSRRMMPIEEKALAAAARAQRRTGYGLMVRLDVGSTRGEFERVLDVLRRENADLSRVAIGHLVARPDNLETCKWLAAAGCFLLFDLFGQDRRQLMDDLMATHPDVQVSSIKGYLWNGLAYHILLSQSVRHVELMTVNGGEGYAYLPRQVLPGLRGFGVSEAEIRTMTVDNPRRFLAVRPLSSTWSG